MYPMLQQPNPSATSATVGDRSQEFRPDTGERESTSGEALLVACYAIIWILAFALIFSSVRKQRSLDDRLTRLSEELARARAEGEKAPGKEKSKPKAREPEDLDA
jgi:CcmD family protein